MDRINRQTAHERPVKKERLLLYFNDNFFYSVEHKLESKDLTEAVTI